MSSPMLSQGWRWPYVIIDVVPGVRDNIRSFPMSGMTLSCFQCHPWGRGWPYVVSDVIPDIVPEFRDEHMSSLVGVILEVGDDIMPSLTLRMTSGMTLCCPWCHPDIIPEVEHDLMSLPMSSLKVGMILCCVWCHPQHCPWGSWMT